MNWVEDWEGEEENEKATAWRLLETYVRANPKPVKPEAVEVPVECNLDKHGLPTVIGILDLVKAGVIVDFKTSSQTPDPEKVAHTTEVQTSIYSVLYRENTERIEQGIELHHLVKLKNPKVVVTALPPMSENQQSRLFTLMEAYVEGLDRRDFVPSAGQQCSYCEYLNECRAWH